MNRLSDSSVARPRRLRMSLGLLLAVCALQAPAQSVVKPPPLPPGSSMVKIQGGMNEQETRREVRAHHHKFHHKKDYTRDDSMYGDPSQQQNSTGGGNPVVTANLGSSRPSPARMAGKPSAAECEPDKPALSQSGEKVVKKAEAKAATATDVKNKSTSSPDKPITACDVRKTMAEREAGKSARGRTATGNKSKETNSGSPR
jgi:hypothetical protein